MSRATELLRELVAINSVNPTLAGGPGEGEIARWVAGWLGQLGLPCEIQEVAPGRPNVIARVAGTGEAPSLLFNAHLDTVGVEGMDAPFELRSEGDRLYGRGTYDMKASAAIMLALAAHFHTTPPPGDLWLTFVCDEEDASVGMEALVGKWLPSLAEPPAAALVLEPTEENIAIAHKGFAWYEITVRGRAGHGSRPEEAIDAILPLGAALQLLQELEQGFITGPRHPLLGRPSLHASLIQGGSAWSVYPASARLCWERRTLPDESPALLEQELARVMAAARAINQAEVEGGCRFSREPLGTPAEAEVVRALRAVAPNAQLQGLSFWTDGALLDQAGLPTVIFGPIGHGAHATDEWVSQSSMERVITVLRRLVESAGGWAGSR